jgi:preprotein translocase subunit SecE
VGLICSALRAVIAWAVNGIQITWPSRRETMISTVMVLVMVVFASLFFFAADQLIGWILSYVLNTGN